MGRLGRFVAHRARVVALVWAGLVALGFAAALGGVFGESVFSRLSTSTLEFPSESLRGQQLLAEASPTGPTYQLVLQEADPASARVSEVLAQTREALLAVPGVEQVVDPSVAGPAFVSTDGAAVLVSVALEPDLDPAEEEAARSAVLETLDGVAAQVPGATGAVTGESVIADEITAQVETDLKVGEAVALPISLLVMVVIFGGFAAAGVPIAGAVASIAGALTSLLLFSYVIDLDASVVNVVTVLGLGLCIDYALLVVSRYREEIGVDHSLDDIPDPGARADAMERTMATAGRTVLFSALTVAIAVSGLLLIGVDVIRSVGAAALSVVLVALLVAITLVPALLVLMTRWVSRRGLLAAVPGLGRIAHGFGDAPPQDGFFSRLARRVQRRPWLVVVGVTGVLVLMAIPSLRLVPTSSGIELLPTSSQQRQVVETIDEQFPATAAPQVQVVVDGTVEQADAFGAQIVELRAVDAVAPARTAGDLVVLDVVTPGDAQGAEARKAVEGIRAERPDDLRAYVIGPAASLVDFVATVRADAPLALAWLAVATFVLLFLLTGSVLIPIKALVMIVLSLGATFGALVWIFQDGRGEGLLGYTSVGGIEAIIPILVFAFAFGLSMDYEVFLLARIKEFHDAGLDNDDAVAAGLQRTGRVITSAALLVVIVFAGFVLGDLLVIKQTGVALAVAVLIDATLVRILLVPATMTVLGEWNWWAPRPLQRLHARIGLRD
jgi:RND superfamily putative drug exporter